jgi:Na+-transporting NADH:ubiquinone oxidoreductase subunit NqrC
MVLFLMAISTACALLLSGANLAYQRASRILDIRLYRQILDLFEVPYGEEEVERVFRESFDTERRGGRTYYLSRVEPRGTIVYTVEGSGLWSRIRLLLAVDPDLERMYGLRVLEQAETPGLGGRIGEEGFQRQFRGVSLQPALRIVRFASAPNEVNAVTGATRTSRAMEGIIGRALDQVRQDFGERRGQAE